MGNNFDYLGIAEYDTLVRSKTEPWTSESADWLFRHHVLDVFLSPHFRLFEFLFTSHLSEGLFQYPFNPDYIDNLHFLCVDVLEPLRLKLDRLLVVNSGYRSPYVNKSVGGASKSDHLIGKAADISTFGLSPSQVSLALDFLHDMMVEAKIVRYYEYNSDKRYIHISHV